MRDPDQSTSQMSDHHNNIHARTIIRSSYLVNPHTVVPEDIVLITESAEILKMFTFCNFDICSDLALFLCGLVSKTGLSQIGLMNVLL